MSEHKEPIPSMIYNASVGGHVTNSQQIIDENENKEQSQINAEVKQTLGQGGSVDNRISKAKNDIIGGASSNGNTLKKIEDRVSPLESAVGTGGSVDSRIAAAVATEKNRAQAEEANRYTKSETYTKKEVHNLITTPNQKYVSVIATSQTTSVTDILPTIGVTDTIYRIGNWNGTQYNDSVFSEYTWNGSTYIKLSTKSQVGEVYDISINHADIKYENLATALGTNGENIPQSLRKGGMSIKYVQSSDNKYIQYRLMAKEFTTNTTQWTITDEGVYVENPEFIYAKTDNEGKILWAIKTDGSIYYGVGIPQQVIDYINEKIAELSLDEYEDIVAFLADLEKGDKTLQDLLNEKVDKEERKSLIDAEYANGVSQIENPEFAEVHTDADNKVLYGVKHDGDFYFGTGIPSQIQERLDDSVKNKVNKEEGKSLIDEEVSESLFSIEDPEERSEVTTDVEGRILSFRDKDGIKHENGGIETLLVKTDNLSLTEKGMTDFQQALKDAGFNPGGKGDLSNKKIIELPKPRHYALLNLIVNNVPAWWGAVVKGFAEYYDFAGNYFKKSISLKTQGQTSVAFAIDNGKGNYTLDLTDDSEIKFGSWVSQDSWHLKGCAKDVTKGYLSTSYKWAYMMMEYLNAKPNRQLSKEDNINTTQSSGDFFSDWGDGARCIPDGFPVEIYLNGVYWGMYSLQLKKHRKNYSMDKKDYTSCFIDPDHYMPSIGTPGGFWEGEFWWNRFEIRGPKELICMDGSEYDGDAPKELIDETSEFYDASNKKHKGSAQTKHIIESFSTKYLEVKALIDSSNIEQAKEKFEEYFDYNACMLVYVFNSLMCNSDSIIKNTLWGIWNNKKIAPLLWDLDGVYGEGWIGTAAGNPNAYVWNYYKTPNWPLALFGKLYFNEIKEAYYNLRRSGIISIDIWREVIYGWINSIGVDAYKRDLKKWPETPSYRKNYTNTEYWVESGGATEEWNENTVYQQGDKVYLPMSLREQLSVNRQSYKAVQTSQGVCPVTEFYNMFPRVGGYYDSPKRMEKWMEEQIKLCDVEMGYFKELLADFTAYRVSDPGYEIQCINITVNSTLSKEYNFIQGHIIRHETVVEGQTISIYTIDSGIEAPEDTSKTYTTVRAAIETAASQPVDIPSKNVYYIKARVKNISYYKK